MSKAPAPLMAFSLGRTSVWPHLVLNVRSLAHLQPVSPGKNGHEVPFTVSVICITLFLASHCWHYWEETANLEDPIFNPAPHFESLLPSVILRTFTILCSPHQIHIQNFFIFQRETLCPLNLKSIFSPQSSLYFFNSAIKFKALYIKGMCSALPLRPNSGPQSCKAYDLPLNHTSGPSTFCFYELA